MQVQIYIREKKVQVYEEFKAICLNRDIPVSRQIEKLIEQHNKKYTKRSKDAVSK